MNAHRPQKCLIDMSLTFGTKKVLTSKVRIYIYIYISNTYASYYILNPEEGKIHQKEF